MFPWNIAKSAEAMFSRRIIKHVLKFLLKKKLGQFILGDLDLDQLEVQLGIGTIQLTDLALNVDYINQKLGSLPFILKEGSIGSLLAKICWRSNCQIEVDELELVFIPFARKDLSAGTETSSSTDAYKHHVTMASKRPEQEVPNYLSAAVPLDVHEGVKTIAKMVKWFLTSFHIKVKKLIVAFDPCSEKDNVSESHRVLVLRISELEYGTSVSEEKYARSNSQVDSVLGLSRLTNFVKFQGAVVEFLQMDDVENDDNQSTTSGCPGTAFCEWSMGSLPSEATTPILTGKVGGFSGNLKLSIPWRNGSLDIQKVDADISIDPIHLRLQPNTIIWILCLWESLKNVDTESLDHTHDSNTASIYYSSASQFYSNTNRTSTNAENFLDWVAVSNNLKQNDGAEVEPDLSASIDQFFECFDGLRTSHSALGNSGIFSSVFSAITAASSLASGSLLVPSEQQPVETNFRVSFSEISVEFSLCDEVNKYARNSEDNGLSAHYLGAKCQGLLLVLQIFPLETKFEATIQHIELDDYFNIANESMDSGLFECENTIQNHSLSIQNLQAEVQGALPRQPFSQDPNLEQTKGGSHLGISSVDKNDGRNVPKDSVRMKLFKTSSITSCTLTIKTSQSNGTTTTSISFSVKLPPFVFWVNFNLVKKLLGLLQKIDNSMKMMKKKKHPAYGDFSSRFEGLHPGGMKGDTSSHITRLRGSISLSFARVMLCIPSETRGDLKSYFHWQQFIALDITQASRKNSSLDSSLRPTSSRPALPDNFSSSIYLDFEDLKMYLITAYRKDVQENSASRKCSTYFAEEIISVNSSKKCFSCIGVLWQDGPVSGHWVANRARGLATSQESTKSRTRVTGRGSEFASVTTMGAQADGSSCTQEIIVSSTLLLHVGLPFVSVKLSSSQYQLLCALFNQIVDDISHVALDASSTDTMDKKVTSASQTSVLFECNLVEISVNLDKVDDIKPSLKTELPGSWQNLKLHIQKLELLSVSNIGGISGSTFFWLGHGEGELQGSTDGCPAEELLLISCRDSTICRGDGEGANALSSGSSGTTVVFLSDPQTLQKSTTVTIRGGTIIAPGGRLDWSDALCQFFSLPSRNDTDHEGSSDDSREYGASLVINLVDVALSYEPHISSSMISDRDFKFDISISANASQEFEKPVRCLLAAASLNLSNETVASSVSSDYKIRLQDLGLLISSSSRPQNRNTYDIDYLHKAGYVKVAGEALVEAILRTNCKNGLRWELECCDSQLNLDTCQDTTSGLMRLAAQLQQLFAPDLQESMVHLQSRWKAVQQVNCSNDVTNKANCFDGYSASSPSSVNSSSQGATGSSKSGVFGLMDNICEDAFIFDGIETSPSYSCESDISAPFDGGLLGEAYCSSVSDPEYFSPSVSFNEPIPQPGVECASTPSLQKDCFPKVIEGYYISGLSPPLEKFAKKRSRSISKSNSRNQDKASAKSASSGWYTENSPRIVDNHVPKVTKQHGGNENPKMYDISSNNHTSSDDICKAVGQVLLKNINVRWRMYAGSDWRGSVSNILTTVEGGRDTTVCLELKLSAVDLQYDMYPNSEVSVSKLSLSVQDINLYDHSRNAPWKLVLGYYHSKDHPRESSAKAFKLDLEAVRPDPSTPLEEYRLRLALSPMLLHLDQDQLDFLISFFGEKESLVDQSTSDVYTSGIPHSKSSDFGGSTIAEEALLPFFQKFDIWPIVIRVDYSPRRVDLAALRGGNYVHLINLVPWKGIELHLKHVHAAGIYGWSSVCETIVGEWLEDISHNQVHKLLKGLPPIRSLFTVGSGAAKLVSLPVKNYKKDHRLVKGIQRGAVAFLRSISLEAVGLGVHLAAGAHDILLQTEYIFTSPTSSASSSPTRSKTKPNVRSNQPKNAQQGMQQAYASLSDGLGKSASALVGNPLKAYQRSGSAGSALVSAVCGAPSAAIAPASAAVRAVHCALVGVRNSLDPEHKKESMEKYLGPTQPLDHN
ncbi:hypothetical protein ACHQM5_016185 [Ranunculus cassubicifolius]